MTPISFGKLGFVRAPNGQNCKVLFTSKIFFFLASFPAMDNPIGYTPHCISETVYIKFVPLPTWSKLERLRRTQTALYELMKIGYGSCQDFIKYAHTFAYLNVTVFTYDFDVDACPDFHKPQPRSLIVYESSV